MREILPPKKRVGLLVKCSDVAMEPSVPVSRYFRSAGEIYRMARVYQDEGALESAFILYTRFITLRVEKLPSHPEYRRYMGAMAASESESNKKRLESAFKQAEELKATLLESYETAYANEQAQLELELAAEASAQAEAGAGDEPPGHKADYEDRLPTHFPPPTAPPLPAVGTISYPDFMTHHEEPQQPVLAGDRLSGGGPSIPDRSTKPLAGPPSRSQSQPSDLRPLLIPNDAVSLFASIAQPNTLANLETCGILCGKLMRNRFTVTHVLVPKQSGSADSCTTQKEEDVFAYQDSHDLITLGWIHTHPTQTAFLSSVDMHTQASYQIMLHEAVAVVVAPKFNETGIFVLTHDYGLPEITKCQAQGFHPHDSPNPLFETAVHAQIEDGGHISCNLVDLR